MSELNVIAILTPAPGKAERVKELLMGLCEQVHSKEDSTIRYLMTEQIGKGGPAFVMVETYKSKEASLQHSQQPHFKSAFANFEKEKLFAKAPQIVSTVNVAGFDLDRKLVRSKL